MVALVGIAMETKHHRTFVDRHWKWNCKIPLPPGVIFSPKSWHVSIHYWHFYFGDKKHRHEVYCWPRMKSSHSFKLKALSLDTYR